MIKEYNIAIIGGGPAGIAAGIYGKYDGNMPIILETETLAWLPENHVNLLTRLEGFPGLLNTVNGTELVDKFRHSLSEMDVDYKEHTKVLSIERRPDHRFIVKTTGDDYDVSAIVLATGTNPTQLSVSVVGPYVNDVHYYALDNYQQYVDKEVIVMGSRNSGSTAALYLARHGVKVTIIEIKPSVQAKEKHTKFFKGLGIHTITSAEVIRLDGDGISLQAVVYKKDGQELSIPCVAVFPYIGIIPETALARALGVEVDEFGYVSTNFYQQSNQPGIFVAGDMCGDLKHIVAASGQGAKAAYNVNKYFNSSH